MIKRVAAITTSRNNPFFASKWLEHYGRELGRDNLYMFLDGKDQKIPPNAGDAHITVCEHTKESVAAGDKSRVNRVNELAARLFNKEGYDMVIGCDADEYLILDPDCDATLTEYLSRLPDNYASVSALGIDVGQKTGTEAPLNCEKPVLEQRGFAVLCSRYTKPVIMLHPSRWGSGFHRIEGHNFHIDGNLYLFHLGYCDMEMLKSRLNDGSLMEAGWERHLGRRARTIDFCTNKKPFDGDSLFPKTRWMQSTFRPFYAWNKPGKFGRHIVITIPDRFRTTGL
ncbi:MAG: glycosyltransferase family 2 protein [Bacteroidales bacterium]|jgi:hypothetical protein|nr:glycosyltransferase family 2 protein [Bacteroidales bacterium]MCI2121591.1 glycosyltransferase family 2 protein [Bacteroidales bacterium]MCI2145691.1 glycosyltransferase family 2 protein [Bacteroidales bacterium]